MNRIKEIRKLKSVSVTTLAEKLQMSQSNLTKIENGKIELKPVVAQRIAEILGVGVTALYGEKGIIAEPNSTSCRMINPQAWNLPLYSSVTIAENMLPPCHKNIELYIQEDDTMSPMLPKGAVALIDTTAKEITLNGVYLIECRQQLMLRRIQKTAENTYICLTENKSYSSETLSGTDIMIRGKCVGSIITEIY